jgi:N6-adenosine-specific RNA methylase IME4
MTLYSAIIADPPWQYGSPRAIVGNGGRGAVGAAERVQVDVEQHYRTLSLPEIKALPIQAADDAVLFMWVTNPFLCDGSGPEVVRAWGFTPKTVLTWAKVQDDGRTPSMKTGHWFRSASEHVIFGVRGRVSRPDGFPAIPTWFPHKRLPHSVKPDAVHELAELARPNGPWLEMFARRQRRGWDVWGDQVPTKSARVPIADSQPVP